MNSEFLPINTYSNNVVETGPCTTFRGWNSGHRAFKSIIIFLGLNGEISQLKNSTLIMNTYKKKCLHIPIIEFRCRNSSGG